MSTRSNLEKALDNCQDLIKSYMVMLAEKEEFEAQEVKALHLKMSFPELTHEEKQQLHSDWNECLNTTYLNHAHVDHDLNIFLKDCEVKRKLMELVFEHPGFSSKAIQLEKYLTDYENQFKNTNGECRKTIGAITKRLHDNAENLSECIAFLHEFGNEIQTNNPAFAKKMDEFALKKNSLCAELYFSLATITRGIESLEKLYPEDSKIFLKWFKEYSSLNFTENA
jgi:hypothetical protein